MAALWLAVIASLTESPAAAATFTVNSTADTGDAVPGDGICDDGTGACTMNAAVDEADPCAGPTVFDLQVIGTIEGSFMFGSPNCDTSVELHGPGADLLTLAGSLTFSGQIVALPTVTRSGGIVSSLTIGGSVMSFLGTDIRLDGVVVDEGVDVYAAYSVALTRTAVAGAISVDTADNFAGFGALPNYGTLSIDHSLLGQTRFRGTGEVSVYRSRLRDVQIVNGELPRSTLDTTISESSLGNLQLDGANDLTDLQLTNTTVNGDVDFTLGVFALGPGAGPPLAVIHDATVSGDVVALATITNSIVVGSIDASLAGEQCSIAQVHTGVFLSGNNLVGSTGGCVFGANPALVGLDPLLGPLADNGGPTPTRALLGGSPAIDAGVDCRPTDQRGLFRPQGTACDIGAFEFACGNGAVDLGETCDDGNTLDGDCCSANCQFEPSGSPCADGNACTTEACDGTGSCAPGMPVDCGPCQTCNAGTGCVASVLTGCHQPTERFSGRLEFLNKTTRNKTTRKLTWQWTRGDATHLADFGHPFAGERYALCLFDESGPTPQVAFMATTGAGLCGTKPCWRTASASSFAYKDREQTPDGIDTVLLKSGPAGKAKVLISGKGTSLTLTSLPLALPARMQLQAENGQCWEGRYFEVSVSKNDETQFKGKAFQP